MSQSSKKNFTIFILVAAFILFIWGLLPFYMMNSSRSDQSLSCTWFGMDNLIKIAPLVLLTIGWFAVSIWVYRDAEKRKMNGLAWGLLVFIGSFIGLLIYLIVRSDTFNHINKKGITMSCPNCQRVVETTFTYCPNCGSPLRDTCKKCSKEIEADWQICPYCGEKLPSVSQ